MTRCPMRLRKLAKRLKAADTSIEVIPKKGRHQMRITNGKSFFPVTAHNGLNSEISKEAIDDICDHFGIDPANIYPA